MRKVIARLCSIAVAAAASPAFADPPMYTMVELGHIVPGSSSVAIAISDATAAGPVVVGQSFTKFSPPTLSWRAVTWRPSVSTTPVDLLPERRRQHRQPRTGCLAERHVHHRLQQHVAAARLRWSFDPPTGTVTHVDTLRALGGDGASGASASTAPGASRATR
jgi:hypothetical protein